MVKNLSSNWIISDLDRSKINQLLKYQPVKSNTIGKFVKTPIDQGLRIVYKINGDIVQK